MGVLTADERFTSVIFQKFLNIFRGGVHLAFHIAGVISPTVIENALIMNQTGRIQFPEEFGHLIDDFSAEGFISAGPDQDRRMVFIPLISGIDAVQTAGLPIPVYRPEPRPRYKSLLCPTVSQRSMGFHIVLSDHINTKLIAELIDSHSIRVMAGTDRIDIVPFHRGQIL